eukprot:2844641-Alexandrium_andersonii.AAC.1
MSARQARSSLFSLACPHRSGASLPSPLSFALLRAYTRLCRRHMSFFGSDRDTPQSITLQAALPRRRRLPPLV